MNEFLIAFVVTLLLLSVIIMLRNGKVFKERMRIVDVASARAKQVVEESGDWKKEYEVLERYSYHEMVLKFWKPVKSFYKDVK